METPQNLRLATSDLVPWPIRPGCGGCPPPGRETGSGRRLAADWPPAEEEVTAEPPLCHRSRLACCPLPFLFFPCQTVCARAPACERERQRNRCSINLCRTFCQTARQTFRSNRPGRPLSYGCGPRRRHCAAVAALIGTGRQWPPPRRREYTHRQYFLRHCAGRSESVTRRGRAGPGPTARHSIRLFGSASNPRSFFRGCLRHQMMARFM